MRSELMWEIRHQGYFYNTVSKDKCHIVYILMDGGVPIVLYKWYGKHKQYWHYACEPEEDVNHCLKIGIYSTSSAKPTEDKGTTPAITHKDDGVMVYTAKGNVYTAQ